MNENHAAERSASAEIAEHAASAEMMRAAVEALGKVFPGCAVVLLVAPFGAPPNARVNYASNARREDISVLLREVVGRFEGRAHDAPTSRQ